MRSIKVMLCGITILVVAIYLEQDGSIISGDGEFLIMVIGLIVSVIGLIMKADGGN